MKFNIKEKFLWLIFGIASIYQAFTATLQLVGGIIILLIPRTEVVKILIAFAQKELLEDSRDFFALHVLRFAEHYSLSVKALIVTYLLIHGFVKLYLLYGIWTKKDYAYPVSIGVFSVFLIYELHRHSITHSGWLSFFIFLDIFYILLLVHEYDYRVLRKRRNEMLSK